MSVPQLTLKWTQQYQVAQPDRTSKLSGDKITLPQSALEALLAAAPLVSISKDSSRPYTSSFDPFNPYTFAAEREARQQFSDHQQQLPHPLTFRLVNSQNGRVVYAGIREFSAEEGEIGLSEVLQDALGLRTLSSAVTSEQTPNGDVVVAEADVPKPQLITVHAKQLPKGTHVRLRPLEAGYDPEDWKSLLERYLRDNFTTLTKGEVVSIPSGRQERFQFLVDKLEPDGEGICIVDTDLEVDIEALNEEQARETLSKKLAKSKHISGTREGSSTGGTLVMGEEQVGQVLAGEYVDYEMKTWSKDGPGIDFCLEIGLDDAELDLFISPLSTRQRAKPRNDEHVFGEFSSRPSKRIRLSTTNVELEDTELLYVSVHAYKESSGTDSSSQPIPFVLSVTTASVGPASLETNNNIPSADEITCKNCHQFIPRGTLPLHEAFCYRNNISCPDCKQVFLKSSPSWKSHWHCPHDSFHGSTPSTLQKHNTIFHPSSPFPCPSFTSSNCTFTAQDLPTLARHRTTTCPAKEILCQFCHLTVPQQSPTDPPFTDPQVLLSGLTPHEVADGARTTECHLCDKIIRLRDLKTHLRIHDRDRIAAPKPKICSNNLCGRTLPNTTPTTNHGSSQVQTYGLCAECFGPLYITTYDPEGKALRRRIERRLLQQLMAGCGKQHCTNERFCRTAKLNLQRASNLAVDHIPTLSAKDALPLVKPLLDQLASSNRDAKPQLCFCVDEPSQTRRSVAERLVCFQSEIKQGEVGREGAGYELEWWVKGLEETRAAGGVGGDRSEGTDTESQVQMAREWLALRAPMIGEVPR